MQPGSWSVAVVFAVSACSFTAPPGGTATDGGDGGVTPQAAFLDDASLQDEASGPIGVPVSLSVAPTERVTVAYEVRDGSATRGEDYTGDSGTLTFEPGTQTAMIDLAILQDATPDEPDETIELRLTSATGATLGLDAHTITISSNLLPRASITTAGSTGLESQSPTVQVFLDPPSPGPVTIEYTVTGDVSPADHGAQGPSFTIPANTANFELALPITDDPLDEFDEDLVLTLTGSPDVIVTNSRTRTHTITDNDLEPGVGFAVATGSVNEAGTSIEIDVALQRESGKPVTVNVSSTTGTQATVDKDYTYGVATVTIPPGQTVGKVRVDVVSDALDEINEALLSRIDAATNAVVEGTAQTHNLSIIDDDLEPSVRFACGGSTAEPLTGSRTAQLGLELSAPSGRIITVQLATDSGNNNADDGADYTLPLRTITIPVETSALTFDVTIYADLQNDTPEDIEIDLANPTNASIGSPSLCTHVIANPL